jgi:hypothetical protein
MMDIEESATLFNAVKVGKKVGRRAKVKNATNVTYKGIEFDSKLECNCYKALEAYDINFIFKPEKLTLVPGFTTKALDHTPENAKELRSQLRALAPDKKYIERSGMSKSMEKLYRKDCKADQSRAKRLFNIAHRKVIVDKKMLPVTWAPDFYLPNHTMYVESKGFANDGFPIKFKQARYQLGLGLTFAEDDINLFGFDPVHAIEVGSKKEMIDLLEYLKKKENGHK